MLPNLVVLTCVLRTFSQLRSFQVPCLPCFSTQNPYHTIIVILTHALCALLPQSSSYLWCVEHAIPSDNIQDCASTMSLFDYCVSALSVLKVTQCASERELWSNLHHNGGIMVDTCMPALVLSSGKYIHRSELLLAKWQIGHQWKEREAGIWNNRATTTTQVDACLTMRYRMLTIGWFPVIRYISPPCAHHAFLTMKSSMIV
jgi:hypothetical protein